jgi:UDP-N-acetylmuramoylalanine--D-glutamate ligase
MPWSDSQPYVFDLGVMLNLSADHLDRHGTMAAYAAAKAQVFARQEPEDLAVLGQDDDWARSMGAGGLVARRVPISGVARQPGGGVWAEGGTLLRDEAGAILDLREAPALPGGHNAQNAAAAAACALDLGLTRAQVAAGMRGYSGLPHRQERVGELAGVAFVNDSKATNADSAARALASYDRVVWIAGGVAKEGGIEPLGPLFPRIAQAVLIGESAGPSPRRWPRTACRTASPARWRRRCPRRRGWPWAAPRRWCCSPQPAPAGTSSPATTSAATASARWCAASRRPRTGRRPEG